ncbi:MAG TPA: hypothetical protein VFP25_01845 [Nitrososphaeraceae archaeon]|nr:hypothetical protein [Nitrososphaeraceae archaeon]
MRNNNNNTSSDKAVKTIRLTKETYDRLAALGDLKDSFDIVIRKLIDENTDLKKMKNKLPSLGGSPE